jgi:hypothetical protein
MSRTGGDLLAARRAARQELAGWTQVHARRDDVVRAAFAAGLDTYTIHEITGLARTTIARILPPAGDGHPRRAYGRRSITSEIITDK